MKKLIFTLATLFSIYNLKAQLNMEEVGYLSYSENLSDVWGYVDEEGNEYALVGVYDGFSVVDISDPGNPEEIFFGSGPGSIWRDIKTWGDYAYVSNESGNGIYIVDLSPLPDGNISNTTYFDGDIYPFSTVHNIYIDEQGRLYIFGANNGSGGAIICDLTQDPINPVELGQYNDYYFHDGMARNDTLWGAILYQGMLGAIDVSDPSNPTLMGTVNTPSQFTHNAWVSDDGSHVFTTDEVGSGFIGAYNVTDLSNMYETDRIQSSPGSGVIPHNVHVLNDFLITSYYADGIVVHDAKHPDKLFEVANFDTSPSYSGYGFNGSWGAYPYLPSGLVLASDIEMGLYILEVNYVRAAFLEGIVADENTGSPIFNVNVEISEAGLSTQTAFDGSYEFGTLTSGTFDVIFSKSGYSTKTITDVELENGEIQELDVELESVFVGVQEMKKDLSFKLYPNPFEKHLNLNFNNIDPDTEYKIDIFDISGMKVSSYSLKPRQTTYSFGQELSAGMYFVRISNGSSVVYNQSVIKK